MYREDYLALIIVMVFCSGVLVTAVCHRYGPTLPILRALRSREKTDNHGEAPQPSFLFSFSPLASVQTEPWESSRSDTDLANCKAELDRAVTELERRDVVISQQRDALQVFDAELTDADCELFKRYSKANEEREFLRLETAELNRRNAILGDQVTQLLKKSQKLQKSSDELLKRNLKRHKKQVEDWKQEAQRLRDQNRAKDVELKNREAYIDVMQAEGTQLLKTLQDRNDELEQLKREYAATAKRADNIHTSGTAQKIEPEDRLEDSAVAVAKTEEEKTLDAGGVVRDECSVDGMMFLLSAPNYPCWPVVPKGEEFRSGPNDDPDDKSDDDGHPEGDGKSSADDDADADADGETDLEVDVEPDAGIDFSLEPPVTPPETNINSDRLDNDVSVQRVEKIEEQKVERPLESESEPKPEAEPEAAATVQAEPPKQPIADTALETSREAVLGSSTPTGYEEPLRIMVVVDTTDAFVQHVEQQPAAIGRTDVEIDTGEFELNVNLSMGIEPGHKSEPVVTQPYNVPDLDGILRDSTTLDFAALPPGRESPQLYNPPTEATADHAMAFEVFDDLVYDPTLPSEAVDWSILGLELNETSYTAESLSREDIEKMNVIILADGSVGIELVDQGNALQTGAPDSENTTQTAGGIGQNTDMLMDPFLLEERSAQPGIEHTPGTNNSGYLPALFEVDCVVDNDNSFAVRASQGVDLDGGLQRFENFEAPFSKQTPHSDVNMASTQPALDAPILQEMQLPAGTGRQDRLYDDVVMAEAPPTFGNWSSRQVLETGFWPTLPAFHTTSFSKSSPIVVEDPALTDENRQGRRNAAGSPEVVSTGAPPSFLDSSNVVQPGINTERTWAMPGPVQGTFSNPGLALLTSDPVGQKLEQPVKEDGAAAKESGSDLDDLDEELLYGEISRQHERPRNPLLHGATDDEILSKLQEWADRMESILGTSQRSLGPDLDNHLDQDDKDLLSMIVDHVLEKCEEQPMTCKNLTKLLRESRILGQVNTLETRLRANQSETGWSTRLQDRAKMVIDVVSATGRKDNEAIAQGLAYLPSNSHIPPGPNICLHPPSASTGDNSATAAKSDTNPASPSGGHRSPFTLAPQSSGLSIGRAVIHGVRSASVEEKSAALGGWACEMEQRFNTIGHQNYNVTGPSGSHQEDGRSIVHSQMVKDDAAEVLTYAGEFWSQMRDYAQRCVSHLAGMLCTNIMVMLGQSYKLDCPRKISPGYRTQLQSILKPALILARRGDNKFGEQHTVGVNPLLLLQGLAKQDSMRSRIVRWIEDGVEGPSSRNELRFEHLTEAFDFIPNDLLLLLREGLDSIIIRRMVSTTDREHKFREQLLMMIRLWTVEGGTIDEEREPIVEGPMDSQGLEELEESEESEEE